MSNDLRTLELFAEANPVPDELAMETREVEPAAYLATLQTRSSEVTQLDERVEPKDDRSPRWMVALAAAAVVILIGVVTVLINQGSDEQPPVTQPPVESSEIDGYWSGEEADFFFGDGEYAIVIDGALSDSGTYITGIREADNRIVTITSGDETVDCTPGDVAIINYDFVGGDTVQLSGTTIDDCGLRPFLDVEIIEPSDPFEIPGPRESTGGIDLDGTWSSGAATFVFADDAFAIVQNDVRVDEGTFELGGEPPTLIFTSSSDSAGCAPGAVGQMVVSPDSPLTLIADSDECLARSFLSATGPTLRLTPEADLQAGTLPAEINISGTWADDTVEAEFVQDSYEFRIDDEVVDTGTYVLMSGPYRLALESSSDEPNCSDAVYEIALEGGERLTMRPSTEQCPARNQLANVSLASTGS